jgi:D-glycero-D-manno-heptose 1,7-bisphosphate phosphatase
MLRALERELGVSLGGAPFIGDRVSDLDAALAVGAQPILVRTGTGAATEAVARARGVPIFDDLRGAVASILGEAQ